MKNVGTFSLNGTFSLPVNYSFFILSCDKIWLQPEIEEVFTAYSNLRKFSVSCIFVEFDILWTMTFLVATPSIEITYRGDIFFIISFLPHLELQF
jgi:hypothetical protein